MTVFPFDSPEAARDPIPLLLQQAVRWSAPTCGSGVIGWAARADPRLVSWLGTFRPSAMPRVLLCQRSTMPGAACGRWELTARCVASPSSVQWVWGQTLAMTGPGGTTDRNAA